MRALAIERWLRRGRLRRGALGRGVGRLLRPAPRALPAQPHRGVVRCRARQVGRAGPQAPPAGLGARPRDRAHHLDVRPAGAAQRLVQPGRARRGAGRVPAELLRRHEGRDNAGDESDRLLVRWDIGPADEAPAPAEPGVPVLTAGPDGRPGAHRRRVRCCCGVPGDIEALRARIQRPRAWRVAVRDTLGGLMDAGARVSGFDRDGGYVVRPPHRRDGNDEGHGRRAAPDRAAAGGAVPDLVRHRDCARGAAGAGRHRRCRGLGRVRRDGRAPLYSSEYIEALRDVLRRFLVPRCLRPAT